MNGNGGQAMIYSSMRTKINQDCMLLLEVGREDGKEGFVGLFQQLSLKNCWRSNSIDWHSAGMPNAHVPMWLRPSSNKKKNKYAVRYRAFLLLLYIPRNSRSRPWNLIGDRSEKRIDTGTGSRRPVVHDGVPMYRGFVFCCCCCFILLLFLFGGRIVRGCYCERVDCKKDGCQSTNVGLLSFADRRPLLPVDVGVLWRQSIRFHGTSNIYKRDKEKKKSEDVRTRRADGNLMKVVKEMGSSLDPLR